MTNYAARLCDLTQKREKLLAQEKRLIDSRKKQIADLAEKFKLLTLSDQLLIKCFSELSHERSRTPQQNPHPIKSTQSGDSQNDKFKS